MGVEIEGRTKTNSRSARTVRSAASAAGTLHPDNRIESVPTPLHCRISSVIASESEGGNLLFSSPPSRRTFTPRTKQPDSKLFLFARPESVRSNELTCRQDAASYFDASFMGQNEDWQQERLRQGLRRGR